MYLTRLREHCIEFHVHFLNHAMFSFYYFIEFSNRQKYPDIRYTSCFVPSKVTFSGYLTKFKSIVIMHQVVSDY